MTADQDAVARVLAEPEGYHIVQSATADGAMPYTGEIVCLVTPILAAATEAARREGRREGLEAAAEIFGARDFDISAHVFRVNGETLDADGGETYWLSKTKVNALITRRCDQVRALAQQEPDHDR